MAWPPTQGAPRTTYLDVVKAIALVVGVYLWWHLVPKFMSLVDSLQSMLTRGTY